MVQRCICGMRRYVYRHLRSGSIEVHLITSPREPILARDGSRTSVCLGVLSDLYPSPASTLEIAKRCKFSVKDVSWMLTGLVIRGVADRTEARKGLAGGSRWVLSSYAAQRLRLQERVRRGHAALDRDEP